MQEGHVIESCSIEGTETRFRYPRWSDLDAFIDMHRTLTREKVMCRRLELDAASGGRELSQALVGLKQKRSSYLLIEQDGVLVGEGFTTENRPRLLYNRPCPSRSRAGSGNRHPAYAGPGRRIPEARRAQAVPHRVVRQCLRGPRLPESRLRGIRPPPGLGIDGLRRDLRPDRYGEDHRIEAVSYQRSAIS